ncbi:transporter [Flavihumibacter fluvii]|uniref:transporter n=1 Tax=Flavihumibacter fluvii TaxID=2838157 RepID=UPI001BDF3DB5|nr:transporter [Flavihumibacter fluvii]ULQ53191.1 transporter [Flavihumibacter fluvii]
MRGFITHVWIVLFTFSGIRSSAKAQDLEPRAYNWVPVHATFVQTGLNYSTGEVVTDPTVPLKDVSAKVASFSLGVGHAFSLFGLTAQFYGVLPVSKAQVNALLNGQREEANRSGTADTRFRLSILFRGAPATNYRDFGKRNATRTILGTSLTVQAPTGQYFSDKLINLGNSRWAFKTEIALSQPIKKRWLLDLYTAAWLFTKNNSFMGSSVKSQNPVGTVQLHASYTIKPYMWVAINTTYYAGGTTTVDGVPKNDRVSNFRLGVTVALPTGKSSALKLAFSKGAVVVAGTNFTSASLGWTYLWF